MPPSPQYLVRYNGHQLPGYVQNESNESIAAISDNQVVYSDASLSEYLSLGNKSISLTLRLWECDYATARREAQRAATLLRTRRDDFSPLYVQFNDRHYEALTERIQVQKDVGSSIRTRDYTVDFEVKPWLYGEVEYTLTGSTTQLTTDSVTRTLSDGTWTPVTATLTGTDITISGYTDNGDFAGFLSIPGSISNVVVDSEFKTVTVSGVNVLDRMAWADFSLYVGPGRTTFDLQGITTVSLAYSNRWLI